MTSLPRTTACLGLAAALATGGCLARTTPTIRYYTLSVPPPSGAPIIDATIVMSTVGGDPGYIGSRMAWRTSPYRVEYSSFHRWIAPPPALVSSAIEDYLRQASTGDPSRRVFVSGTVRRIEAVRDDRGNGAVLGLSLVAELGGRRLVERTWEEYEPVGEGPQAEAVAAALSTALARILREFTAAIAAAMPAQ